MDDVSVLPSTATSPFVIINMYIIDGVTIDPRLVSSLNGAGCNVVVQTLPTPWVRYFIGTPLEEFTRQNQVLLQDGPYFYSHLTDLFRLAVLWKHGGWFVDGDVAWIRPITTTRTTSSTTTSTTKSSSSKIVVSMFRNAVADEGRVINNAVSTFDNRHPFLLDVMDHVTHHYNVTLYTTIIQSLTSTAMSWMNSNSSSSNNKRTCSSTGSSSGTSGGGDDDDDDGCLTVLPRSTFFPFSSGWRCRLLFLEATELTDRKIFPRPHDTDDHDGDHDGDHDDGTSVAPYAVHYFSSINKSRMMHPNSTLYKVYQRGCIVCNLPTTQVSTVVKETTPNIIP
jgi:hypothetical protein